MVQHPHLASVMHGQRTSREGAATIKKPRFEWPKRDLFNADQHQVHNIIEDQLRK